jgi:hypothetical protein
LGDREYQLIDAVVRLENRGRAFDDYIRRHRHVILPDGNAYSTWYYIVVHGNYKGSGVDADHLDAAMDALNLSLAYRPEPFATQWQWAQEGFSDFTRLQQAFFQNVSLECQRL